MGYNYGTVGFATVVSGSAQLVSANTSAANTAIRVFDVAILNTASVVSLYAGTSSAAANLALYLDKTLPFVHSDVGFRFIGGVYAVGSAIAGNMATVNYINEL